MTIVVQNRYFIKTGREDDGLATRRRASRVRADQGRPTGRIMTSEGPQEGDAPTSVWECEYVDLEARQADLDWASASEEFTAVRRHMGTLLDKFERLTFRVA
ncbi:hypothetical protein BH23CHL2_BH23CHL2_34720 [soil metagenome]